MAQHQQKRVRVEGSDECASPAEPPQPLPPLPSAPLPSQPPPSFIAASSSSSSSSSSLDLSRYHHVTVPQWSPPSLPSSSHSAHPPLPVHLYGLDPLYFSHAKLLISHLLHLPRHPDPPTFLLSSHPLLSVELVGCVVGVNRSRLYVEYLLDDSTGVVGCKVWKNRGQAQWEGSGEGEEGAGLLGLGAVVRVMGKLTEYMGVREVNVVSVREEEDEAAEMLHWVECATLYDEVYSRASAITSKYQRDVQRDRREKEEGEHKAPPSAITATSRPP